MPPEATKSKNLIHPTVQVYMLHSPPPLAVATYFTILYYLVPDSQVRLSSKAFQRQIDIFGVQSIFKTCARGGGGDVVFDFF